MDQIRYSETESLVSLLKGGFQLQPVFMVPRFGHYLHLQNKIWKRCGTLCSQQSVLYNLLSVGKRKKIRNFEAT